jgi:hypothetical protein
MLEKLAGRLKWERTGGGIRVVIPVRVPWLSALIGGFGVFSLPSLTMDLFGKHRSIAGPASFAPECVGLFLCVLWFTLLFTIKQILTLNSTEMAIQTRTFGIEVKNGAYATDRLQCLRFVSSDYGDGVLMSDMSRIEIDRDLKTRKFAFGITEQEADALIEKMMEVYDFPKDATR